MKKVNEQVFHQAFAKVLLISQIFALLPVSNVFAQDVKDIKYNWLSWCTANTTLILLLNGLEFVTVMNLVRKEGISFYIAGSMSLFVVCILEQIYFWRLATKWPSIMRTWRKTEKHFLRVPYQLFETFNMKRRIYTLTALIMFGALIEHCIFLSSAIKTAEVIHRECNFNISLWEIYFQNDRRHLKFYVPYRIWLLPLLEWINLTLAYARSFTDVFIVCVSIGLSLRFQQLQQRLENVKLKYVPENFWSEMRLQYIHLKRLLYCINNEIRHLVLLAFGNNMFFICMQSFQSSSTIGMDFLPAFSFWFSLLFTILRTLLTIYMGSTVNDISKRIVATLRDVPARSWCLELERFSGYLSFDLTAISGNGFFYLRRELILAMASAVVTYELMVSDAIKKMNTDTKIDNCSNF